MDASWLPRNPWLRRLLIGGVIVYAWTLFGVLSSAHFFLGKEATDADASLTDIAGHVLLFYWAWAAVTPLVLLALRRAGERGTSARRRWGVILVASPAIVVVHGLLYLGLVQLLGVEPRGPIGFGQLGDYAMRHGGGDVATIAVLVAVYLLFDARQRAHEREVEATALEARLAIADLEVLRSQLQPHFLFNALNTVSTLMLKGDAEGADDAMGRISRYLRSALAQRADAMVTVAEEIADVQQYFAIERLRFGSSLCLDLQIAEGARAARMPALILQPLVENAIRHGTSPGGRDTRIGISAATDDGRLRVRVADPGAQNGAGASSGEGGEGFGLRYVRERLRHFYRDDASLAIATTPAGTIVTVDMPLAPRSSAVLA